ncbi:MAG: CHASE2 domain-containing protein [Parvibaculum sp.]
MKQVLVSIGIFLITAALSVGGLWEELDLWALDQRMNLVELEPSGNLVIVAIDVRTLRALNQWPISRRTHARLVETLVENGADQIALDIDLSDESNAEDSAVLAAAFEKARGRIVLPIFFQRDSEGNADSKIVVTRPFELFSRHAWLANVNVSPERDGRVRQGSYGVWLDGDFYMSLPALLAGRADRENLFFYTNYSIRPQDIPRISYVDLLNGRFDREEIAGKKFVIGATAVELGDQFAVPKHGVISGPLIQAMAYETLATGQIIKRSGLGATILGLGVVVFVSFLLQKRLSRTGLLIVAFGALGMLQVVGFLLFQDHAIGLDTAGWSFAILLIGSNSILVEIVGQRRHILRQKLENEYRRLLTTSVVNDSPDAIIIADTDGKVEMANPVAAQTFGFDRNTSAGDVKLSEILPHSLLQSLESASEFPQEFLIQDPTDRNRNRCLQYTLTCSRVPRRLSRDDTVLRDLVTYTFHDVTERHAAEEAIKAAHRQEQEASRAKTEFIANMGHELRTPLNAIIGFSELMTSELFGPLGNERYREYVTDIANSGKHLLSTVNDILDLSRIESNRIDLNEEEINVADAIDLCVRIARSWKEAEENIFEIEAPKSMQLLADASLFKQMLANLLSNAAKFSERGGRIGVRAELGIDGGLSLSVTDTGIGIAEEHIERVTDPFFQVDASLARAHEGTGLGLSLVKAYMKLHQGALRIESTPGKGTTVTLGFPPGRVQVSDAAVSRSVGT